MLTYIPLPIWFITGTNAMAGYQFIQCWKNSLPTLLIKRIPPSFWKNIAEDRESKYTVSRNPAKWMKTGSWLVWEVLGSERTLASRSLSL